VQQQVGAHSAAAILAANGIARRTAEDGNALLLIGAWRKLGEHVGRIAPRHASWEHAAKQRGRRGRALLDRRCGIERLSALDTHARQEQRFAVVHDVRRDCSDQGLARR